jgi:hypothetical protein
MSKVQNKFENVDEATGPLLFLPYEKSLKKIYPELLQYPEFEELSDKELLLAYYFGVYYDHVISEKERMNRALWKLGNAYTEEERKLMGYRGDQLNPKVKKAIKKMQTFDIKLRFRAKKMTEQILDNFEKITNISTDAFADDSGRIDMDTLKKHTDLCISISNVLPSILQKAEAGYGIRVETVKNRELIQGSPLDEYIRTQKL